MPTSGRIPNKGDPALYANLRTATVNTGDPERDVDLDEDRVIVWDKRALGMVGLPPRQFLNLLDTATTTVNVFKFGAVGNGETDDTQALQAAIDALPARGGRLEFPYGVYRIRGTLNVLNKAHVSFVGQSISSYANAPQWYNGPTTILMDSAATPGWTPDTPMILVSTTTEAEGPVRWGGFLLEGLCLRPYSGNYNASYSGHAVVFKKRVRATPFTGGVGAAGVDDFAGNITFRDCYITGANCAVLFDDSGSATPTLNASPNGTGWGWVLVDNCNFQANRYGFYSNNAINVLRIVNSKIWQNTPASNGASDFLTRTGGGVILRGGTGVLIQGTDLEGQQVGVQATDVRNLKIDSGYFEANSDAAAVLIGCTNVTISNCSTDDTPAARIVYAFNCERITLERNRQNATSGSLNGLYFFLGPQNRDVVTDTPELTQLSMKSSHDKAADGYGLIIQTMSAYMKQQQATSVSRVSSTNVHASGAFAGTTYYGHGAAGKGKVLEVSGPSANAGFTAFYGDEHLLSKDEWVVTTAIVRAHPDNNAALTQLYYEAYEAEAPSAPAPVLVGSATLPINRVRVGEWVAVQWCHRKSSATQAAQYENRLRLSVPNAAAPNNQKLMLDDKAKVIAPHPFVRPAALEIFNPSGKGDHYLFDGVNYHGTAPPTWNQWSWAVGDRIFNVAPVAGGAIGWICTTAGAPGMWKQFGLIEE